MVSTISTPGRYKPQTSEAPGKPAGGSSGPVGRKSPRRLRSYVRPWHVSRVSPCRAWRGLMWA